MGDDLDQPTESGVSEPEDEPDYWFFLSYARVDWDEQLEDFYAELATLVRRRVPLPSDRLIEQIGFRDRRSLRVGREWRAQVDAALYGSRVLVCILSRGFLASKYCDYEVKEFRRQFPNIPDRRSGLILLVFWDPEKYLRNLPPHLSDIQYDNEQYGDNYLNEGIFRIARETRLNDDYNSLIDRFSWTIANAPRRRHGHEQITPVSAGTPSPPPTREISEGLRAVTEVNAGPRSAFLAFIVGNRDEMRQTDRDNVESYGEHGWEWRPFLPENDHMIGPLSTHAVAERNLHPQGILLNDELIDQIRHAEDKNSIVLLIIDPWSANIENYRNYLMLYDMQGFINCGIIILWNLDDSETKSNAETLRVTLGRALHRTYIHKLAILDSTGDANQLRGALFQSIDTVYHKILERGKIFQPVPTGADYPLPQLTGPGGDE